MNHTLLWTKSGHAYSFGSSHEGALGLGPVGTLEGCKAEFPMKIEALGTHRVVGVAAGYRHSVIWTDAGHTFTFGDSQYGCLGRDDAKDNQGTPGVVQKLEGTQITAGDAGDSHTVLVSDAGHLWVFGWSDDGRLGLGPTALSWYDDPQRVNALMGVCILGCSTGDTHTVAWSSDGSLYSFGDGNLGLHTDFEWDRQSEEPWPVQVRGSLVGKTVVGATAGAHHTLVWVEDSEASELTGSQSKLHVFGCFLQFQDLQGRACRPQGDVECYSCGVESGIELDYLLPIEAPSWLLAPDTRADHPWRTIGQQ